MKKISMAVTWFNSSVVEWMEVEQNASVLSIVRKRRGLSEVNDWRSLTPESYF